MWKIIKNNTFRFDLFSFGLDGPDCIFGFALCGIHDSENEFIGALLGISYDWHSKEIEGDVCYIGFIIELIKSLL